MMLVLFMEQRLERDCARCWGGLFVSNGL